MRRPGGWLLVAAALVAAGAALLPAAEEPTPPGDGDQGARKLVTLLGEISRNMELIEEMLKDRDCGPECQSSQGGLLKKIDELVEELKKRQCEASGGSQGGSPQQQREQQGEKEEEGAEKKQRPGEKQSGRKPQATGKTAREDSGKVPNTRRGKEKPPPAKIAGPLTEKKGTVGWGFLPGEARALLDGSRRTGIPAEYAEMIRRYFERLSKGAKQK